MRKQLRINTRDFRLAAVALALTCPLWTGCGSNTPNNKKEKSIAKNKKEKSNETTPTPLPDGKKLPNVLDVKPNFAFSDLPYLGKSTADAAAIKARVDDGNALHFALAKLISKKSGQENIIFSGYSIQTAFALLYPATTEGSVSQQEIGKAMRFSGKADDFHQAMLAQNLAVEAAFMGAEPGKKLEYKLVNQVWTDSSLGLQKDYTDTIKRYYNAGIGQLPFKTDPDGSRKTINSIIETNTNELIKDLLPPKSIDSDTITVLTNSIYMLADWAKPFEKSASAAARFNNLDGSTSQPTTMRQSTSMGYVTTAEYQAVSMDYVGNKLAMLIVLPNEGSNFVTFASNFDQTAFRSALSGLSWTEVNISLPKFEFTWKDSFKEHLKQLGMVQVFESDPENFPKIWMENNQPTKLEAYINDVYHQAKIIVDEAGTEAAAATAIVAGTTASRGPVEVINFTVDRPAIFYIYEKANGSILFGGQIVKF